MCHSLHVAVNKCINWCFVHLYLLFYYNNKVCMLMVNYKPPALHGHKNTGPYIFWGSQFWSLGVTWRHRSRDRWTRHMWFTIGGPSEPCVYLAPLRRYSVSNIMGSWVWPFRVTWRHRSRDRSTRHMWFPIGGPLEPCVYLAPLRSYKASKLHLPMLKAKSSLHMLRVTWPVGGGSKITTYLEFPSPHCLCTIQLLWGYDDD